MKAERENFMENKEISMDENSNKMRFMEVAAMVASKKYSDIIAKDPSVMLILAMFSSDLADALFDD